MKKEILLQVEFMDWFVNIKKYPLPTAKSYCDYIAAADRLLEIYTEEGNEKSNLLSVLGIAVSHGNSERMIDIIDAATDELSEENIEIKLNKSLKYIQNWKSALYQYKEFLQIYIDDNSIDNLEQAEREDIEFDVKISSTKKEKAFQDKYIKLIRNVFADDVCYVYTKQDLYKKFHFRIITQDRYYDQIFYPINFISRFLYNNNERIFLDTWVKEMLNNVIIHVEDGNIKLKQVTKLTIGNGGVQVELSDGEKKKILTKTSDNVKLKLFSQIKINKIALDHDTSMYNIMLDNIHNLPTFQKITAELKKFHSGNMKAKEYKKEVGEALKNEFVESINVENLKAEMELISSLTKLQLMDSSENTKKGKN